MNIFVSGAVTFSAIISLWGCGSLKTKPHKPNPPGSAVVTMQRYASAYTGRDVDAFIDVFAPGADHNGWDLESREPKWREFFAENVGPQIWVFEHVSVAEDNRAATAWFTEQSDTLCSGPYRMTFGDDGRITSVESVCTEEEYPEQQTAGVDPALLGQAADIGSTAVAIGQGFAEANPIGSAVGFPAFSVLKLGMTQYADTLPLRECMAMKTSLAGFGWGAAGWNLCVASGAVGGPAAIALCGAIGGVVGKLAYDSADSDSVERCWHPIEFGEKYTRVDADGVY